MIKNKVVCFKIIISIFIVLLIILSFWGCFEEHKLTYPLDGSGAIESTELITNKPFLMLVLGFLQIVFIFIKEKSFKIATFVISLFVSIYTTLYVPANRFLTDYINDIIRQFPPKNYTVTYDVSPIGWIVIFVSILNFVFQLILFIIEIKKGNKYCKNNSNYEMPI